ncbi:hypothetical protein GC177_03805 [bacterium]|nr:hypothetical protein [bacterium]
MTPPDDDVRFIPPDYKLKKKIGIELKYIFTPARIRAAQMVFDEGRHSLHLDCVAHVQRIRDLVEKQPHDTQRNIDEIMGLALNTRCTSDMAGFPIARDLAQILFLFSKSIRKLDREACAIIDNLCSSIHAVYAENRTSPSDHLSIMVTQQFENAIRHYFSHHAKASS